MILLTMEEVVGIHGKLIAKTGGLDGLREEGLLESALYSANHSFDQIEQYPTVEEKAARLAFSIVNNHAFVDGNKRIGVLTMLMTLQLNYVEIQYTQVELVKLGLAIADGSYHYHQILAWILSHK